VLDRSAAVLPITPVPCESSTTVTASYRLASATISGSFASDLPSKRRVGHDQDGRAACRLFQLGFEIGHVAVFVDRALALLARRTPSMIEAWLSSSEMIAEPGPQIVANSPCSRSSTTRT